jgi:hypothetical protein
VRLSRRCQREQVGLSNLLSHNGFGRLRWRCEVAAPPVVCRAEKIHRQRATLGGIDHGDR